MLFLGLTLQASCAFLGIPNSREYTAAQARGILESALEESILLASLLGSEDEGEATRLVGNLLLQKKALESGVPLKNGEVYRKSDVDDCANRLRSAGAGLGIVTTPEAVVLPAVDCKIPAQ